MATKTSAARRAVKTTIAAAGRGSAAQIETLLRAGAEELNRSVGTSLAGSGGRLKKGRVAINLANVGSVELEVEMDYAADRALESLGEWEVLDNPRAVADRVAVARRLLAENRVYPQGCSEFVCAVLGIPWRSANDLMGNPTNNLGARPPYASLSPGDVAGWVIPGGSGHVAIYTGEAGDRMFIDVRAPGDRPRAKNGYWNHDLFKSTRY